MSIPALRALVNVLFKHKTLGYRCGRLTELTGTVEKGMEVAQITVPAAGYLFKSVQVPPGDGTGHFQKSQNH